jgi:hypothetical protein
MASGILKVPAQHVPDVVRVVRAGLERLENEGELTPADTVYVNLEKWCRDMDAYVALLHGKAKGKLL